MELIDIDKNYETITEICDVASNGDGIAKIDGYPLFIKNAVTGDRLKIKVTKTNKNYGFAKILEILSPSPHRREPACKYFEKCGGCDFMHIDYEYQLKLKKGFVTGNMQRIGGYAADEYSFEGIFGAKSTLGYRNKAQFPVGIQNQKAVCGFYSKKSHDIVACNNCLIQNEDINKAVSIILSHINDCRISVYDENTHRGIMRHLYIRSGTKTNELMAVLVTNTEKPLKNEKELINRLKALPNMTCIVQNINTRKGNLVLGEKNRILYGNGYITSCIGNLKFKISPHSFFQINGEQTEVLYSKALEYADIKSGETVFDLYCGTGSISLFLAQKAKKVIGVEIVEQAVRNAIENAELNNMDNAEFYVGDCAETVKRLIKNGEKADIVVVDPPRKGCSEDLLNLIHEMAPKKLVYVSCNSATLARDTALLKEYGYILDKLCAVDMFPMSVHTECVAVLSCTK